MTVTWSELESARFGLRIGRHVDGPIDDAELADYDVVISRRPARSIGDWSTLALHSGFTAIHADSLVYWRWEDDGRVLDAGSDRWRTSRDASHLEALVRDVFEGYGNHYAANPLLGRADILDGYVEWAHATAARDGFLEVEDDDGDAVGFGLVDWSVPEPDVRLAGVCRAARGAGRYRLVVDAMMAATRGRGAEAIRISTQVQNVAVQRVWSALGWKPFDAFETTHLVRTDLLVAGTGSAERRRELDREDA